MTNDQSQSLIKQHTIMYFQRVCLVQRVGLERLNSYFSDYCFVFVFAPLELHPDLAAQSFDSYQDI